MTKNKNCQAEFIEAHDKAPKYMSRRKLHRFVQNAVADNVIERGKELYTSIKGRWNELYFKNANPIVLELACGRGEYTVGLAAAYPDKNFIGIDIKGDRIARGSKRANDANLQNVAFLRTSIQFLEEFFAENEVSEIWLIHPDPQPLDKWEKKRLTFPKFLESYKKISQPDGILRLKTDNRPLFDYSMQTVQENGFSLLRSTTDLHQSDLLSEHHGIETYYEKKFREQGYLINYLVALLG